MGYAIFGETSSTRLRTKSIALARILYALVSIVGSIVTPYVSLPPCLYRYMLNPGEGNWKGKAAFLSGGISLCCFAWGFFRLPECKGRTYEEIDILFERKVPARQFKGYKVDAYEHTNLLKEDSIKKEATLSTTLS